MWIKIFSISIFVALVTFSCNKEINTWDREEGLDIDTTTLLFSSKYVSNIDTQVTLEIDIVTLSGLNSETNYSNQYYYDSVRSYVNHTLNVSSVEKNKFSTTSYTSILLFDLNNGYWYPRERTGFYLRRYFEQVSNSSYAKVGLGSFGNDMSQPVNFYSEMPSSFLNNSWEYNTNTFYNLTKLDDQGNASYIEIPLDNIISRMDETLDHLISLDDKNGDLSITFFSTGNYINGQTHQLLIDNLIQKAQSNGIRINLIGFDYDFDSSIRRLASETGGFIGSTEVNYETVTPIYDDSKKVSNIGVVLENLDLLLSRNVTSHRCNLVVDINAGQGAFTSGTTESIQVNYNGKLHTIQFSIP